MSFQDKANHQLSQLDKELSNYPMLKQFEAQTSIPKTYAVLGFGALYFFLIFFNIGGAFLVNLIGFIIPSYYSIQALFTIEPTDDIQWLTYWISYTFLGVFETAVNPVYWFPFYYTFKFVLIVWMALPQTGGAKIIFNSLLQPMLAKHFGTLPSDTASKLKGQAESFTKDFTKNL